MDHSVPLRGIVICCTSIPDEKRTAIASYAEQMGAVHQLDLTRDVTHLIVGSNETMKYKYVAKNRQDIMPMTEGWIEAIRDLWISDKEIDLKTIEREYMLPTFHSLKLSLTGCEEPTERLKIAELVKKNGATYEGDLTRSISHLISLRTDSAKYKAARSWGLKIVSIEWLYQSLERGMVLEEKLFDPLLPKEEQGKGAWDKNMPSKSSLGRRSREDSITNLENGKRKLRRTASMKLCTQYDRIWADISGSSSIPQFNRSQVLEVKESDRKFLDASIATQSQSKITSDEILPRNQSKSNKTGVFSGCKFWLYNFPASKIEVLHSHLLSSDGELLDTIEDSAILTSALPQEHLSSRLFLIVPHDLPKSKCPVMPVSSPIETVTIWWLERCLHHKMFMEPKEHVIGQPFPVIPIPQLSAKNMILCSSAFTGIDLLHLTRAVELIGATYNDFMTPNASLLLIKSAESARKDKINYAIEWKIPIVVVNWLWDSIDTGTSLPTPAYELQFDTKIDIRI